MVRVSIYNEKGGVGKTTITAMLASYLAYAYGKGVCVLDFDYPSYHFMELRSSELSIAADPKSPLSIWLRNNPNKVDPFDVFSFPPGRGGIYRPEEVFTYLQISSPKGTTMSSMISRGGSLPGSRYRSSRRTGSWISWESRWIPITSRAEAPLSSPMPSSRGASP